MLRSGKCARSAAWIRPTDSYTSVCNGTIDESRLSRSRIADESLLRPRRARTLVISASAMGAVKNSAPSVLSFPTTSRIDSD